MVIKTIPKLDIFLTKNSKMDYFLTPLEKERKNLLEGELPYYNSNLHKKNKKISYGIICVSKDGYLVINKSPPYMKMNMKNKIRNYNRKLFMQFNVNTNEKYNLLLSLFPNSSLEGEYTLPKGKIDDMDKKNSIFTKVREFIEETKYTHSSFSDLLNNHYCNSEFKSFLNDEKYILRESWLGLDNKIYNCEYSVFVIDSINELIPTNNNKNLIVPFKYFLTQFNVYQNCDKYYKRYKQSSNLDSQKHTIFIDIEDGISLLNQHKINLKGNDNCDSRIQAKDIFRIMNL